MKYYYAAVFQIKKATQTSIKQLFLHPSDEVVDRASAEQILAAFLDKKFTQFDSLEILDFKSVSEQEFYNLSKPIGTVYISANE